MNSLRFPLRQAVKSPGFTFTAVVSFALGIGLAVGLGVGFLLTRPLEQIFGSAMTNNPLNYAGVALAICVVGLVAWWLPAQRAAKLDPNIALRAE